MNISRMILRIKQKFYTMITKKKVASYGERLKVNRKFNVNKNTYLGNNVHVNGLDIHGKGKVEIGDNFHCGMDCLMITEIHNYDTGNAIPYDNTYVLKDVKIEDNVWLGDRVIILGGVTIGEGAIIQAGSVVVSDIPPFSIAGGHPAKVFKMRDVEHYLSLKREGKFF